MHTLQSLSFLTISAIAGHAAGQLSLNDVSGYIEAGAGWTIGSTAFGDSMRLDLDDLTGGGRSFSYPGTGATGFANAMASFALSDTELTVSFNAISNAALPAPPRIGSISTGGTMDIDSLDLALSVRRHAWFIVEYATQLEGNFSVMAPGLASGDATTNFNDDLPGTLPFAASSPVAGGVTTETACFCGVTAQPAINFDLLVTNGSSVVNAEGTADSLVTGTTVRFRVLECLADWDGDRDVDGDDFFAYNDDFVVGDPDTDLTGSADPNDPDYGVPDGTIDSNDFFYYLDLFSEGCSLPACPTPTICTSL